LGIDAWADLPLGWKGYAIVDETLIALQKDYASRLLGAVNPYTGLTLAQDPAVVLLEVANENDLYSAEPTLEPYASALTARWEDWLANEGLPTSEPREGNTWRRFLSEIQAAYYQEMRTHLHSIGVQVPIAGTNWGTRPALLTANGQMDFTDSHAYWNHPRDGYIRFDNQPMVQTDRAVENTTLGLLAFSTLAGRPNFVSEWGHPWPNFTRAEGPLWMSATASLQGWDGMAHYTYRHRSGEVAALEGAFDAAIDPAAYALFPTAALLYRRGDITQSEDRTWVEVEAYSASPSKTAHTTSVGQRLTRTLLTGAPGLPAVTIENDDLVLDPATSALHGATEAGDALGQLRHDHLNGVVLIDTPRTQAALGLLGGAGALALGDMTLEVEAATRFAVIAVTSLDGAPISEATRLLLTAVAQVENTGQTFLHDTSWVRDELGGAPILVEPVLAEVSLGRSLANAQAWRLDPLGNRLQEIELPADTIALADGGFSPWIEVLFHALDSGVETGEDEATARDSGAPDGKDNAAGPCGCTARPTPGALPLALLLLLMVRRNRVSSQSPANTGTNNSRPTS
jgi:uncharacterized protein (TIGR03382 family)